MRLVYELANLKDVQVWLKDEQMRLENELKIRKKSRISDLMSK
jgi:hypothetical protein